MNGKFYAGFMLLKALIFENFANLCVSKSTFIYFPKLEGEFTPHCRLFFKSTFWSNNLDNLSHDRRCDFVLTSFSVILYWATIGS